MKKKKTQVAALGMAAVLLVTGTVIAQYDGIQGDETDKAQETVAQTAEVLDDKAQSAGETGADISYQFANDTPGNAYGTITVSTAKAGDYELYWGDGNGKKLTYNGVEFSELGTCTTTTDSLTATYQVPSPYTAVPEGAKELLLMDADAQVVDTYAIPQEKQFAAGEVSYKFALMSDVHYNRYPDDADYTVTDDAVPAFDHALQFVSDQGIDFVGLTGDLSANGEELAFTKFNTAIGRFPNLTVYTCAGNHDDRSSLKYFKQYINKHAANDKNIKEIANGGVDFIYEKGGDIFIFLSQTRWDYSYDWSHLVEDVQLNWLEKNLNKYANKNVYLFFHSYFASEDGDVTTAVGNLINPGGYTYDLTYRFGNADEQRFRKLLNRYPNVTMFNGHSHWAYDQQKYNPNLNIGNIKSDNSGATVVHLSSVSAPRTIEENAEKRDENNGVRSEGTIAIKYKDCTVYMGTDFQNGKYLAYATYLHTDGKKGTPVAEIKVGSTKIKSVGKLKKVSKKSKKYKVKIKYQKAANAYRYQIQYSDEKDFIAYATTTKETTKTSYTISKLKNKKTYYVRVRAYNYQFGYELSTGWSKPKKIKVNVKKKKKKK